MRMVHWFHASVFLLIGLAALAVTPLLDTPWLGLTSATIFLARGLRSGVLLMSRDQSAKQAWDRVFRVQVLANLLIAAFAGISLIRREWTFAGIVAVSGGLNALLWHQAAKGLSQHRRESA